MGSKNKQGCTNTSAHDAILFLKIKYTGGGELNPASPEKIKIIAGRLVIKLCCHSNTVYSHR